MAVALSPLVYVARNRIEACVGASEATRLKAKAAAG
jgi:hypothetical protein